MHDNEVAVDEAVVERLLAEQFPEWAKLPIRRVEPQGTVNAVFRLGTDLAARLPRTDGRTTSGSTELEWLPRLARHLPVDVPVPVAEGRPAHDYPWFWEIHTWVEGETVPIEAIDAVQAARDLAHVVERMQRLDPTGAPQGRGISLAEWDAGFRPWLALFDGDPRVTSEWKRALEAPPWRAAPVWSHGDLDARNWLVRDGRVRGVIDWGSMGVGDPACDVMVAWKLGTAEARDAFREASPTDDATWERARGWALSQAVAVAILAYYTPETNPGLVREAENWLSLVLSE